MKPLVLYHGNFTDGFTAAWVAYRYFVQNRIPFELRPVSYNGDIPEVEGNDVYILDFSYPRDILIGLAKKATSIVLLDHHKTAEEDLKGLYGPDLTADCPANLFCVFDTDKAGSTLAWIHFFPNTTEPELVSYVEDRDLWRWKLRDTYEINAAISSYPQDLQTWDELASVLSGITSLSCEAKQLLIAEGRAILRYQAKMVSKICSFANIEWIGGYFVPTVNSPVLQSEIGSQLSIGKPFSCVWYVDQAGKKIHSLRSDENGLDVSEIAKQFGGGGHKHAAGFAIKQ